MAGRMGLDGTTLHYLALRKAIVSVYTDPYINLCDVATEHQNSFVDYASFKFYEELM